MAADLRVSPLSSLETIVFRMKIAVPTNKYYALSLLGTPSGGLVWQKVSHWVGWGEQRRRTEMRQASIVRAPAMAEIWTRIGEPYVVVNDEPSFFIYLRFFGGHALIESHVAEKYLAELLNPSESVRYGPAGFTALDSVPKAALQRAPSPKQRMRLLKRDRYKCRICGRGPSDFTDVVLHVHHLRPWEKGGLTEDHNLITLCHTCHGGLEPHEDYSLYELLGGLPGPNLAKCQEEYWTGVRHYQAIVARVTSSRPDETA